MRRCGRCEFAGFVSGVRGPVAIGDDEGVSASDEACPQSSSEFFEAVGRDIRWRPEILRIEAKQADGSRRHTGKIPEKGDGVSGGDGRAIRYQPLRSLASSNIGIDEVDLRVYAAHTRMVRGKTVPQDCRLGRVGGQGPHYV